MNALDGRSSTLIVVLAASHFLLASPSSAPMGSLAVTLRGGSHVKMFKEEDEEVEGTEAVPKSILGRFANSPATSAVSANDVSPSVDIAVSAGPTAEIEAELSRLASLPDDWDDSGAFAPSADTIDVARSILKTAALLGVAAPKRAYASPSGEVGLVWSNDQGYADLSFLDDGTVSYYVRGADGGAEEFSQTRMPLAEMAPDVWALLRTL